MRSFLLMSSVLAVVTLTGCRPFSPPVNPPPDAKDAGLVDAQPVTFDAAPDGAPFDDCARAEARLGPKPGLDCNVGPVPFTAAACRRAMIDRRDWRPDCLATLKACAGLDAAYRAKGACP